MAVPHGWRNSRIALEEQSGRRRRMHRAHRAREEGRLIERVATPIFIRVGKGWLPAQAIVEGESRRDLEAVLRVEAHHPLAQVVGGRVGLLEIANRYNHEIR